MAHIKATKTLKKTSNTHWETVYILVQCGDVGGGEMWLGEGRGKITEEQKKRERRVASERSEASPVQWKISISHGNGSGPPCSSSDRPHLSSWHTFAIHFFFALQLQALCLSPSLLPHSISIYLTLLSLILTSFYVHILTSYSLVLPVPCVFIGSCPLSFLSPTIFSQWQLSFLHLIFLRHSERTAGIGGLVQWHVEKPYRLSCQDPYILMSAF